MHVEIEENIEIPQGVEVRYSDGKVTVKGPGGALIKVLRHPSISFEPKGSEVKVVAREATRREKSIVGTFASHVKNMIKGVTDGFEYRMKIVYSHFPMRVNVKDRNVVIENFLGERHPRFADIRGDTEVSVKGDTVTLKGINKEDVSQTAANIEKATVIRGYDPRVFQDGIYITFKGE